MLIAGQWLAPVILATQEAEIGRIRESRFEASLGK
jgi:hypothetical protein